MTNVSDKIKTKIRTNCPICKQKILFCIDPDIVENATGFPLAISVMHCNSTIIAYLDRNSKVRAVETAINLSDKSAPKTEAKLDIPSDAPLEDRTFYTCLAGCTAIQKSKIPNLLEKQLLKKIQAQKEQKPCNISLNNLQLSVIKLEKALNIDIDFTKITGLLDKYVEKGIIKREIYE